MVSDSLGSIFLVAKLLEQPGHIQIQMLIFSTSYMGKMGILLLLGIQLVVQYFSVPLQAVGNLCRRERCGLVLVLAFFN